MNADYAQSNGAKILLVDDDQELLEVLATWLAHMGYFVRAAVSGFDAIALAKQFDFDVVVTDLRMPQLGGLQLLTIFKEIDPHVQVIFLTGQGTMEDAISALRGGRAFDFLQKPLQKLHQLGFAIEKAIEYRRAAQAKEADSAEAGGQPQASEGPLTQREIEIVALVASGLDNREIGERLALSEKTVRNYLSRIYEKLAVTNRAQAVAFCQRHNLI